MSKLNIEMFSGSLMRHTAFEVFIPNDLRPDPSKPHNPHYDRPCKTIFVLHGFTGWGRGWQNMYELAEKYNLALVFPSAENSFYVDYEASHGKYATLVGVEMVEYMRKTFGLCSNKEDTFISGLSMGGFGALYLGLSYPNTFGKIVALSSALLSHGITGMKPGDDRGIANYYYFRNIFGDLDNLAESDKNPEVLITNLLAQGKELPKMYVACGTEDFLLPANQRFHKFLVENNVDANYVESSGDHDMAYWNEYFAKGFEWCLSE